MITIRRVLPVLGLSLLFAVTVGAQQTPPSTGHFGVAGGFTRSTIGSEMSADSAWASGLSYSWSGSERVLFQAELQWVRKSSKASLADSDSEVQQTLKTDYIQIPLLVRVSLVSRARLIPVVMAGPFVAVRARARTTFQIGESSVDQDAKNDVKPWDAGVVVGAGLEWHHARLVWAVDGRYYQGLRSVATWTNSASRTGSFILSAAVRF